MIQEFATSWELFHNTYLAGLFIALLLSFVGALVVARDQIFLGAAVSQASTLGIAAAMQIGATAGERLSWLGSDLFISTMAVAFCILATLFTWCGGKPARESYEAATGWIFLISGSLSVLLLAHSPHGLEEIYKLLSSNIIGASRVDVTVFGLLLAGTFLAFGFFYRHVLVLAIDPAMALSVGIRAGAWEAALSIWLGMAIGLSIRSAGMLYTFGALALPALIAKNLCREVLQMFIVSPLIAFCVATFEFVLANHYDYPPAQMAVALLSLLLAGAWAAGRFLRE